MLDRVYEKPVELAAPPPRREVPRFSHVGGVGHNNYAAGYKNQHAVVIAIDDYSQWSDLEGYVKDGARVKTSLTELGFDEVTELYNGRATRQEILRGLGEELRARTMQEDLVVIFFAGHAETETLPSGKKRGYIVPVDGTTTSVFSTAISMHELVEVSHRITAKHVLYVVSGCYSGLGVSRGGVVGHRASPDYVDNATKARAIQVIVGGRENEEPLQGDDGTDLFTMYFLKGLSGDADTNNDGYVTGTELGRYVTTAVSRVSAGRQNPQFGYLEGSGDIVLGMKAKSQSKRGLGERRATK